MKHKRITLLVTAVALLLVSGLAQAQTAPAGASHEDDDFGMDYSLAVEKKLAEGLSFEVEGTYRSQDNLRSTERWTVGGTLEYRFWRTQDKKFNLKAFAGFEYAWRQKLEEVDAHYNDEGVKNGYNVNASYWRHRSRLNAGVLGTYKPSKRWTFQLKETYQNSYYQEENGVGRERWRYNDDDELYLRDTDARTVDSKHTQVLRSKLTASYNVKGIPLEPFVSADLACGLGDTEEDQKWRFTGGADYTIAKQHKFSLWYRYTTSSDDDDVSGHLIGLGYKFSF